MPYIKKDWPVKASCFYGRILDIYQISEYSPHILLPDKFVTMNWLGHFGFNRLFQNGFLTYSPRSDFQTVFCIVLLVFVRDFQTNSQIGSSTLQTFINTLFRFLAPLFWFLVPFTSEALGHLTFCKQLFSKFTL